MDNLGDDNIVKKRVLITGANGFIGSKLMDILKRTDWELVPLVRSRTGLKSEVVIDFCAPNFCRTINSLSKVDAIVHLGAKIGWDSSSKHALFVPNVLATGELVRWAKRIEAYFVFASAAIVCGVKNSHITSVNKPNPDTDYGYSKWLAEEIIQMSGVKYTILRIAGVFGKDGPSHLGINKAINDALNGIRPIQYGDGGIKRNYIYVKDLSNIIKFCIENKIEGTHLVAGSINTISEMLQIICDVILIGKKPEYRKDKDGSDQIIEHSVYLPRARSFEEAIRDIINVV